MIRLLLLLALACSAQALDYTISTTGPQHVTQGHYMTFNVLGTVLSGTDESVTPTIAGLPTGATATWTNLLVYCCTTFRSSITGLNPVKITAASNTPAGTYPLTITYTSASAVVRTALYSLVVDPLPGPPATVAFPPDVPLTGLAQWQTNMTTYGHQWCQVPAGGPSYEGFVWYYDGTRNYYQIADYTGDPQWLTCARNLDTLFQAYILGTAPYTTSPPGNIPGWHAFSKGLAMGYKRDGVIADKTAIQDIQTRGYANFGNVADTVSFLLSREMSYGLETNLEAESVGIPRIANFQNVVEVLIGHFDQWFLSQTAGYTQPFMVALASEALIQYWNASYDPRVPPLLKLAADQLRSVSWDATSQSFFYYNNGGNQNSPIDPNCTNGVTTPCKVGSPDLNLLIVPLYGWVYRHTGQQQYRDFGDQIFNAGVAGAYLGNGKHFSQNYRWSGRYLNWRSAALVCDLNGDDVVNVLDVQLSINKALGQAPCSAGDGGDLDGDGTCDVVDVQRVIQASLGGPCLTN